MLPDKETRELIYSLAAVVAIIAFFIYNFCKLKTKKQNMSMLSRYIHVKLNGKEKQNFATRIVGSMSFLAVVETIICVVFTYSPASLNFAFGNWVGTGANYFGLLFFLPLFMVVMSFSLWLDPLKQSDISVPGLPLALVFTKIACFTSGCCHGCWWPGGPYSYRNYREEFPIQLVEAAVAFLLFLFLLWYQKRAKKGTVLPLYTILYGATRFITEFWRGEELVWKSLRLFHFLCIISIVVGFVELIVVLKYGDKISSYFNNTFYFSKKRYKKIFKR